MPSEQKPDVLSAAMNIYNNPRRNQTKLMDQIDCRALNQYGILSLSAIASVVGVSMYKAEKALFGMDIPTTRGHLNPAHLSMLMYMRSSGKVNRLWLNEMLDNNTSLITIATLTGISESTLRRARRHG